jgi:SAM-dependent methyltransferase
MLLTYPFKYIRLIIQMHNTALISGKSFAQMYGEVNKVVLDVGGTNYNGSLKQYFEELGMKYICLDIAPHPSVDIVIKPGDKYPFEDMSIDLIVSTSCFEHDPCFWITFKEMSRVIKLGGFIYVNAPTNGVYHCYPGDNWRFYSDAGQALSYWSSYQISNEPIFPVKVVETFHILPKNDIWLDFVCVWKRVDEPTKEITVSREIVNTIGPLETEINRNDCKTQKKC